MTHNYPHSRSSRKWQPSFDWNAEAVEMLTRLWADGLSSAKIAEEMGNGLSRMAIIGKVHRLKLPPRVTRVAVARIPPKRKKPRAQFSRREIGPPVIAVEPVREPPPLPPDYAPVTLADIRPNQCRYIHGDPDGPQTLMCGAKTPLGKDWCRYHHRLVYHPPQPRQRRQGAGVHVSRFNMRTGTFG